MTAYGGADQGAPTGPEQPEELVEPLADTQPPAPTVAPSEPPPVIPPPSAPSPSAEIRAQHTAILRQIQHHLGITSAPEHAIPSSLEPSQAPSFVDQPMPHQEPPTGEAAEHHSTSLRRYHFLPIF